MTTPSKLMAVGVAPGMSRTWMLQPSETPQISALLMRRLLRGLMMFVLPSVRGCSNPPRLRSYRGQTRLPRHLLPTEEAEGRLLLPPPAPARVWQPDPPRSQLPSVPSTS
jgi:hypothetical protein